MVTPEAPPRAYEQHIASAPLRGRGICAVFVLQGFKEPRLAVSLETARRSRVNGMSGLVAQ